jgi:hypothetical protein
MRSREQGRLICAKDNGGSGAAESTKTLAAPPRVVLFARVRLTIQSPGRTATWLGAVSSSGPIAAPGSAVRSGGLAGTAGAHISNGMARYEVLIRSGSGLSIDG